jgi:hypothetical protein
VGFFYHFWIQVVVSLLKPSHDGFRSEAAVTIYKHPRTTHEHGNHVHTCKHSYSAVGVNEQRNVVNSGVRGTKNNHLMIEMDCIYYLSYRNLAPSC